MKEINMKNKYSKQKIIKTINHWTRILESMNSNNLCTRIEKGFSFDDILEFLDTKLGEENKTRNTKIICMDEFGSYYGIGFSSIRANNSSNTLIIDNLVKRNQSYNLTIGDLIDTIAYCFDNNDKDYDAIAIGEHGLHNSVIKEMKIIDYKINGKSEKVVVISAK